VVARLAGDSPPSHFSAHKPMCVVGFHAEGFNQNWSTVYSDYPSAYSFADYPCMTL
jgi:hypothetical protein